MKRYLVATLAAIALVMSSGAFAGQLKGGNAKVQRAVVELTEQVKLLDVILKGEYVFVHDDEKMAAGQPCSYVYTSDRGRPGKLLVSFHCIPVEREKASQFTVIVEWNAAVNMPELVEYRFAGDTEGHKVPKPTDKP